LYFTETTSGTWRDEYCRSGFQRFILGEKSGWKPLLFGQYCEMKVKVVVTPKAAVLDPQGAAVRDAMQHLGMPEVRDVRVGKYLEIDVDSRDGEIEKRLHGLCRDLLSNPVIEDYQLIRDEK
jgi:phosphoribosylformylglycinamidine synthase subunit PurS